jgi:hypothetical protein
MALLVQPVLIFLQLQRLLIQKKQFLVVHFLVLGFGL